MGSYSGAAAWSGVSAAGAVLGRFIVDFLAPAERLVIEVDGGCHAERGRADARRDAVLARAGYRVLRLDASLVARDIGAAVVRAQEALL